MGVAQLVEHQVVALRVAGSSPVAHPNDRSAEFGAGSAEQGHRTIVFRALHAALRNLFAPVAQLDRALASEAKGRAFESRRARQIRDSD